jgi:hypothetical protein
MPFSPSSMGGPSSHGRRSGDRRRSPSQGAGSSMPTPTTPLLLKARFTTPTPIRMRSNTPPSLDSTSSPSTSAHSGPSQLTLGSSTGAQGRKLLETSSNAPLTLRARGAPKEKPATPQGAVKKQGVIKEVLRGAEDVQPPSLYISKRCYRQ